MGENKDFSEDTKLKCLLWSARHCCICDTACGLDIEIAHINPKGGNGFENAIAVCYKHHAEIGRYNKEHPRGNKYRITELKKRKEQIYEKYTRELVPPLVFYLTPRLGDPTSPQFALPRVGFVIENHGAHLPVNLKVNIRVFLGNEELRPIIDPKKPYYSSKGITWNLNAGHIFFGNFSIPERCVQSKEDLKIEVQVTAIDSYRRSHPLLPNCYTYVKNQGWFTEPTSFSELRKFANNPLKTPG